MSEEPPSLTRFDAVCFDMDGTLLDLNFRDPEMNDVRRDLHALFAEHGIDRSFSPLLGTLEEALATLATERGEAIRDRVERQARERITAADVHAARHQAVRRFAPAVLEALGDDGVPFVVVTNNSRRGAEIALEASGLPEPAGLVARDDVDRPKPDPEMVTAALELLETSPDQVAMVGDRPSDARSAKRAADSSSFAVTTVLLDPGGPSETDPDVDYHVQSLASLGDL